MAAEYRDIQPGGADTGTPLNVGRRVRRLQQYVDLNGKWILDCGCGSGAFVLELLAFSPHVFGVDLNAEKVRNARSLNAHLGRVHQGNIEQLGFHNCQFDVVLLNEVLEHVRDEDRVLSEIHRVLKPGGTLALFAPNRLYPFETHGCALRVGVEVSPLVPLIPYIPVTFGNTFLQYYARNYFPWELARKLRRHGFTIQRQFYVWQTFENCTGLLPQPLRVLSPFLRRVSFLLENIPWVRAFGISQAFLARK